MTPLSLNLIMAFSFSLLGVLLFRSHLMSTLLCLEGMMLTLFMILTTTTLNLNSTLTLTTPIMILVFAASEAAVGLALLVMISTTYGTDHIQNLNLLQC